MKIMQKISVLLARIGNKKTFWAIIFLLALSIRLIMIFLLGANKLHYGDEFTYYKIATSLTNGEGFSLNGEPTAIVSPAYPTFLALATTFSKSILWLKLLQAILASLGVILIYNFTKQLTGSISARIAALAYAIYPPISYLSAVLYPQLLGSLWILVIFYLWLLWKNRKISIEKAFLWGILIGIGLSLIPMLLIIAIIPSYQILRRPSTIASALAGIILILAPWTARNAIKFNRFIPLSTVGWANLWAGNCEYTTPSSGSFPIYRTSEGKYLQSLPLDQSIKEYRKRVLNYIFKHPARVIYMYPLKFINFWRPYPKPITKTKASSVKYKIIFAVSYLILLLFAIKGMILNWSRSEIKAIVFSMLLFAAGYAIFFTRVRFRLPAEVLLIVLGSMCFGTANK